ncbi:hypothetical protein [Thermococcus sp.]
MRNAEEKKEILKKAYNLGYFVGFYGHSEWLSWIVKEKEEIYSQAKFMGIYKVVKRAYAIGKERGIRKREELIMKGLSVNTIKVEELELRQLPLFLEEEGISEVQEERYLNFLQPIKITNPHRLLRENEMLKKPKFFNLPKFLRG